MIGNSHQHYIIFTDINFEDVGLISHAQGLVSSTNDLYIMCVTISLWRRKGNRMCDLFPFLLHSEIVVVAALLVPLAAVEGEAPLLIMHTNYLRKFPNRILFCITVHSSRGFFYRPMKDIIASWNTTILGYAQVGLIGEVRLGTP